eukprot:6190867-Pleurochrysis_carterae.AAC.1
MSTATGRIRKALQHYQAVSSEDLSTPGHRSSDLRKDSCDVENVQLLGVKIRCFFNNAKLRSWYGASCFVTSAARPLRHKYSVDRALLVKQSGRRGQLQIAQRQSVPHAANPPASIKTKRAET